MSVLVLFFSYDPCGIGQAIIFLPFGFCFSSFFLPFLTSPNLRGRRVDVYRTSSANLECRSEMCRTRLAGNTSPKISPKIRQIFAALRRRRHLYLAGRPSRWALAHSLVFTSFSCLEVCDMSIFTCFQTTRTILLVGFIRVMYGPPQAYTPPAGLLSFVGSRSDPLRMMPDF